MRVTHDPVTWASAAAAFAGLCAITASAAGYFYLYDDFAILRVAADTAPQSLISSASIGFYRPLPFLLMRAQFLSQQWNSPALYAAGGMLLHVINAVLVGWVARCLGVGTRGAFVAAVLFGLSAPSAEAYFWLSATFDRLCAFGALLAIIAGLTLASAGSSARSVLAFACGLLGALIALFSKETAVMLPLAFAGTVAMTRGVRVSRVLQYLTVLALTSGAYLAWRHSFLPGLNGAYGPWRTLVAGSSIGVNAGTYVRAVVHVPLPWHDRSALAGLAITIVWILSPAAWVVAIAVLAKRHARAAIGGLAASIAMLIPVLWASVLPGTTASGRFLYVPGIWLALIAATALHVGDSNAGGAFRATQFLTRFAVVVLLASQAASVVYQARIWMLASRLSRQVVHDMGRYGRFTRPLYITNLPSGFLEGPYILKDYAFVDYYGGAFKPHMRARRVVMSVVDGRARVAGWLDPSDTQPEERVIELRLDTDDGNQRRP